MIRCLLGMPKCVVRHVYCSKKGDVESALVCVHCLSRKDTHQPFYLHLTRRSQG